MGCSVELFVWIIMFVWLFLILVWCFIELFCWIIECERCFIVEERRFPEFMRCVINWGRIVVFLGLVIWI